MAYFAYQRALGLSGQLFNATDDKNSPPYRSYFFKPFSPISPITDFAYAGVSILFAPIFFSFFSIVAFLSTVYSLGEGIVSCCQRDRYLAAKELEGAKGAFLGGLKCLVFLVFSPILNSLALIGRTLVTLFKSRPRNVDDLEDENMPARFRLGY